jgi:hypothetical protein
MALRGIWVAAGLLACAGVARAQAPGLPVTSETPVASEAPARNSAPPSSSAPIKLRFGERFEPQPVAAVPIPIVPAPHSGISPTYFWIAASATIIVASLAGFEALHVRNIYDEAQGLPPVAPVRERLHDRIRTAEITADLLLLGSVALAVGTTLLAFHVDWSGRERPRDEVSARANALARVPPSAARRRWW